VVSDGLEPVGAFGDVGFDGFYGGEGLLAEADSEAFDEAGEFVAVGVFFLLEEVDLVFGEALVEGDGEAEGDEAFGGEVFVATKRRSDGTMEGETV
jgi:hypothetical protein